MPKIIYFGLVTLYAATFMHYLSNPVRKTVQQRQAVRKRGEIPFILNIPRKRWSDELS